MFFYTLVVVVSTGKTPCTSTRTRHDQSPAQAANGLSQDNWTRFTSARQLLKLKYKYQLRAGTLSFRGELITAAPAFSLIFA